MSSEGQPICAGERPCTDAVHRSVFFKEGTERLRFEKLLP